MNSRSLSGRHFLNCLPPRHGQRFHGEIAGSSPGESGCQADGYISPDCGCATTAGAAPVSRARFPTLLIFSDEQIRTFSILFLNSRDRYPVPVIILRVSSAIQFLTFTRYIFYQSFFHIFSHLNSFQRLLDLFGHRIVSYLIF